MPSLFPFLRKPTPTLPSVKVEDFDHRLGDLLGYYQDSAGTTRLATKSGPVEVDLSYWARGRNGYAELPRSDEGYARAYLACAWAFRAVNVLVQKTVEVLNRGKIVDKETGEELPDHLWDQAREMAYRAWQQDTYEEWMYSKAIYGEAYVEKVKAYFPGTEVGYPATVRVLDPVATEPFIQNGRIISYHYAGQDGVHEFRPDEIAFDKYYNPLDPLRGYSLIAAALDAINVDRTVIIFDRNHLKNNARPGLIFTPKAGTLTPADEQRIRTTLQETVKGPQNAGRPLFMPVAFDVTTAEPPEMEDMDVISESMERRILSVIGVPRALVDYTDMAFQLSPEQNRTFYDLTLIPNAEKIARVINIDVLPFFDLQDKAKFEIPVDEIRAELGDPEVKARVAGQKYRDNGITMNEYRQELNEEKVPGGDVFMFPSGVVLVPESQLALAPQLVKERNTSPPPTFPALPPNTPPNGNGTPMFMRKSEEVSEGILIRQETASDELKAWRKYARQQGWQKAVSTFKVHCITDSVAAWVRDELMTCAGESAGVKAIFEDAALAIGNVKNYSSTREEYQAAVKRAIQQARSDEGYRREFAGILRSTNRRFGLQTIYDAFEDGDHRIESLDEDTLTLFKAWQTETSGYITDFGAELFKEGGITDDEVDVRAELWANKSLDDLYYTMYRTAAPQKEGTWRRNPQKDSCDSCIGNDGLTLTVDEWGKRGFPRDRRLTCGGWECGCDLFDAQGKRIGAR